MISQLNKKIQDIAPEFNIIGNKQLTALELIYDIIDKNLILSNNLFLMARSNLSKLSVLSYMNVKFNFNNWELLELYPKIKDNYIFHIIPSYSEKLVSLKDYPFEENSYCSYNVKQKKVTDYYNILENRIFRYSFDGSDISRHYLQINQPQSLKEFDLDISQLEEPDINPSYVILYFNGNNKPHKMVVGYNPIFSNNYDKLLKKVNLL